MKRAAAIPFENQQLGGQVHRLLSKSNGVCEVPILHWDPGTGMGTAAKGP